VLRGLLDAHPRLVRERLGLPAEGYFRHPYLIWFVADNPIRNPTLPGNIVEVTRTLIDSIEKQAPETYSFQVDFTLGLVATGRIPKECGIQIALMDMLIDAGAEPKGALGAIAQDNPEAAAYLIRRGAELTFAVAVGLGWEEEIKRLAATATPDDWSLAIIVAAFRGNAEIIRYLLRGGSSVNVIPVDCQGFHGHATALHQAVSSASLESVKLLVEAGADLHAVDREYEGTPLDWAGYLQREGGVDEGRTEQYREIEAYLRSRDNL
jgi:peptide-methionine (S)-S-oxide reductase